jgi:2-polyprenyl-6-methoxyphenol hydroxylase-like FAD-dependent oxidoreductase
MAGQGLNLGLLDANILANVVCRALADGSSIGNEVYLMEYEALAKKNNYLMQTNLEFLKMAFGLRARSFSALRNLSIDLINKTPAKDLFMSFADGDWNEETRRLYINPN